MPWNEQKGGNGGGDSPWGRPNRPGSTPPEAPGTDRPDLEETFRRMQERFKQRRSGGGGPNGGGGGFGGGGGGLRGFSSTGVLILIAVGAIGWLMTGVYQVNEQEQAVVLRFGKVHRSVGPGFQVRLPNPIETHYTVPVNRRRETAIGDRPEESLMLTGDENIVNIDFSINWKVNSPQQYLFNIAEPEELVRQIGESAMREVVGTSAFGPITTGDRTGVEDRVRTLMQTTLNTYKAGIEVESISLKEASAPPAVIEAQQDVSSAEQDRAKRINEANQYRNTVVPQARGDAQRIIQDAEAYKASQVAISRGEADRFNLIYEEYRKAPRVTRERMYLETMEVVLGRTDKIIIDSKNGPVPVLPLDMSKREKAQ